MTIQFPIGIGGDTVRVLADGEGSRNLTLIHGLGARADRWQRNLPALAEAGFRCIAADLPGHGLSFKRGDFPFSVRSCTELTMRLLDTLEIERTAIIGTSFGGYVGAMMACMAPERVSALVLVGSIGIVPLGEEARGRLASRFGTVDRHGIEAKLRTVIHDDDRLVTSAWIDEEWRINNSPGAVAAFETISSYIRSDIDDDVVGERLAAQGHRPPIAVIWGSEDKAVPPSVGAASRKAIEPDLYVEIASTGHCPYFEQSGEFNAIVTKFLGSLPE